jgi:hypothetical protein
VVATVGCTRRAKRNDDTTADATSNDKTTDGAASDDATTNGQEGHGKDCIDIDQFIALDAGMQYLSREGSMPVRSLHVELQQHLRVWASGMW